MARNPFPQFNSFRGFVYDELNRRRWTVPQPITMPFVRFTSGVQVAGLDFFHIGFHNAPPDVDILQQSYGSRDVIGYAYSAGSRVRVTTEQASGRSGAEGRHPAPGVTSVQIQHLGVMEPIRVRVNWKCYNTSQLEVLQGMFGIAGAYVICEIGHTDSTGLKPPSFEFSAAQLAEFARYGRSKIIDNYVSRTRGNYDLFIGQVTDYEMQIQPNGSYECFTEFYSIGEALYGLPSFKSLSSRGQYGPEPEVGPQVNTIHDYFSPQTGEFDKLLKTAKSQDKVVEMRAKFNQEFRNNVQTLVEQQIPTPTINSEDRAANREAREDVESRRALRANQLIQSFSEGTDGDFISFNFLLREVIPHIFKNIRVDENQLKQEIKLFQTINIRPNFRFPERDTGEPVVGDNRYLASIDPQVVIVKQKYVENDPESVFAKSTGAYSNTGAIYFGSDYADGTGGYLSTGVWLSTELVRRSFLTTNTFREGLQSILYQMNRAVASFWNLALVFDEDEGFFKIIDKNYVASSIPSIRELASYTFNRGSFGELLSLTFSAEFSKEMKAAVLLSNPLLRNIRSPNATDVESPIKPHVHGMVLSAQIGTDIINEAVKGLRISVPNTTVETQNEAEGTSELARSDEKKPTEENSYRNEKLLPFKESMKNYIKTQTQLIEDVFYDGLSQRTPNSFVAPVPTEIELSLTMRGISGLSFFDVFDVAKLPNIYRDTGVFAINNIEHSVDTTDGWTTTIGGFFYYCYPVSLGISALESDENVQNVKTPTDSIVPESGEIVDQRFSDIVEEEYYRTISSTGGGNYSPPEEEEGSIDFYKDMPERKWEPMGTPDSSGRYRTGN